METPICHNLRRDEFTKVYRQVGREYYDCQVYSDRHSGMNRVFSDYYLLPGNSYHNRKGILYNFLACNDHIMVRYKSYCYKLDQYPVPPVAIVCSGDDIFVLLSGGHEPRKYTYRDGEWRRNEDISGLPVPYALKGTDIATYSAVIPAMTLKGSYTSRSTSLSNADASAMGKAMGDAFCALADKAMVERAYVSPVIARYQVRGKSGDILYISAPVLVTSDESVGVSETLFTLSGDNLRHVAETTLSARGFKLSLLPLAPMESLDGWKSVVASVEILVSPQLHPYIPGVSPWHAFGAYSSDASRSLTVRLPGVDGNPFVAAEGSRFEARVASVLSRLDDILVPYESERPDTLTEISTLRKLLSEKIPEMDSNSRLLADFMPPHGFSAETAVSGGDVILWGNLRAKRFCGYSTAEIAAKIDLSAGAVPTAAKVKFSDDSSVVSSSVLSHPPVSFSPLIVYPHCDAVEIELRVGASSVTLPLKAAPGGRWSYYLSPSCAPVTLGDESDGFVLPAASPPDIRHPDTIAVSSAATPFRLSAVTRCGGNITCVTPTALPVSSWDFARANFYAFTDAGINAVTVNSRRDSVTAARIDPRCVESAEAVAVTPAGVMAVASGDLVRLNSNRAVTLVRSLGADRIGWSQPFEELWCVTDGETEVCVVNSDGTLLFTRDNPSIARIHTSAHGLYAVSSDGKQLELSREVPGDSSVRYRARIRLPDARRKVLRLMIPLLAEKAEGDLNVYAGFGAVDDPVLAEFHLSGALTLPIVTTVPSPSRMFYTISLNLTGLNISIL